MYFIPFIPLNENFRVQKQQHVDDFAHGPTATGTIFPYGEMFRLLRASVGLFIF